MLDHLLAGSANDR